MPRPLAPKVCTQWGVCIIYVAVCLHYLLVPCSGYKRGCSGWHWVYWNVEVCHCTEHSTNSTSEEPREPRTSNMNSQRPPSCLRQRHSRVGSPLCCIYSTHFRLYFAPGVAELTTLQLYLGKNQPREAERYEGARDLRHHCHVHSRNKLGGDSKIGSGTKPHCCRWIRAGPLSHGISTLATDLAHTHHPSPRVFWHCILSQAV